MRDIMILIFIVITFHDKLLIGCILIVWFRICTTYMMVSSLSLLILWILIFNLIFRNWTSWYYDISIFITIPKCNCIRTNNFHYSEHYRFFWMYVSLHQYYIFTCIAIILFEIESSNLQRVKWSCFGHWIFYEIF